MAVLRSDLILSLKDRVSGPARGVMGVMGRLRRSSMAVGRSQAALATPMLGTARGLAFAGAGYLGLTAGIGGTIGAAMKFENSMADIRKVIDFKSPKQFDDMRSSILDMSKRLPVSADGIAAIMAAAGQANVPMEDLKAFTTMTAKVATAWDMAEGETGDALAKMKTALGLTVGQTGLLADAINHLSNNTASSAPNLLRFSRGLAVGKQAGFAAQQTLAFGAAMIGSGYEAEVAETSFRNMVKALTAGGTATKQQRGAFKKLGFDAVTVSRDMQKNAVGTTLAVFDAIRKLPKAEQGSIATALFGSEARALPALIGNMQELRRDLGLVSDQTKYAGSAQREFEQASKRTSNTLQLLKNNINAIGVGIGDRFLGPLNQGAGKLAETLLTLDSRVTVFDRIKTSAQGFLTGLGLTGGDLGAQIGSLYDAIFGKAKTFRADVDAMGATFERFRRMGGDLRSLMASLASFDLGGVGGNLSALAGGLKDLTGAGSFASYLALAVAGSAMLKLSGGLMALMPVRGMVLVGIAGGIVAISKAIDEFAKSGSFVEAISRLSTLDKTMAGLTATWALWSAFKVARGIARFAGRGGASPAPQRPVAPGPVASGGTGWLKALGLTSIVGWWAQLVEGMGDTPGGSFEKQVENQRKYREFLQRLFGIDGSASQTEAAPKSDGIQERGRSLDGFLDGDPLAGSKSSQADDVSRIREVALAGTPTVVTRPEGVQPVQVMNPQRPNLHFSFGNIIVQGAQDAEAVARHIDSAVREKLSGLQADEEWAVS